MTHPTWELSVDDGALILMPCPGTNEIALTPSLTQLKSQGIKAIVSALSQTEMQQAGVGELSIEAQLLGIPWFHHPIAEDEVPNARFMSEWQIDSPYLQRLLSQGDKVAIHCFDGSNRTAIVAFHLLQERQWPLQSIISQIQALRPHALTQPAQRDYIERFYPKSTMPNPIEAVHFSSQKALEVQRPIESQEELELSATK